MPRSRPPWLAQLDGHTVGERRCGGALLEIAKPKLEVRSLTRLTCEVLRGGQLLIESESVEGEARCVSVGEVVRCFILGDVSDGILRPAGSRSTPPCSFRQLEITVALDGDEALGSRDHHLTRSARPADDCHCALTARL